jgi:dTDP-4-dehydrorhamnose 3,5-epimerase
VLFTSTAVEGVYIIDVEPHADERGSLSRAFCAEEFEQHGIEPAISQMNLNHSERAGTIRGLHYQRGSHAETKLVRCVRGAVFDVAADMREGSETYGRWVGVELSADNRRALLVPEGCAHGFQTLVDDVELLYTASHPYTPASEAGVRYSDPHFGIDWPLEVSAISDKDATWPLIDAG